jgi:hypothetical protein
VAEGAFWNNWKNQVLPASGATVSNPNASGAYTGFKGGQQGTSLAVDPFIADIIDLPASEIRRISEALKAAGYLRTATSKYNKTLADAYIRANQEWTVESARTGREGLTLGQFLSENAIPVSTGGGKPGTQRVERVDDNTTADARVAKAFEELGLTPSAEQLKEWRKKLQAEQKKNPTVTKYVTKGGVQTSTTTGGLDDEFWLQNNISKAFKAEIDANKLKDPTIERRAAAKKIYDQVTKGLTGQALIDAANKTDYGRNILEGTNRIKEYAIETGITLTDDEARSLSQQLYDNGQDADNATIRSMLRGKITVGEGVLGGKAGNNLTELKKTAAANGLDLTKAFGGQVQNWLQSIEQGESIDTFKQVIRNVAKLGLPDKVGALVDQGVDLDTIYSPYRRQMASLLEVDEDAINLDDPLLRSAIGPDKEMSLYDFKRTIRKDPRWQYTDNAREDVSNVALQVLRDFGFQG